LPTTIPSPPFSAIMRPPRYLQRLFVEHDIGESSGSTVDVARRAGYPWPEQMDRKMLRNVEKRGVQAARNGPSEDSKCWQRIELGIHGLKSWDRNWSRKVRETRSSSSHQCSKKNRCRSLRFSIPTIFPASHSLATGHDSLATGHDLPAAYRSAGNWLRFPATFSLHSS